MDNEDDWASVDHLIDAIKGLVDFHGTRLKRTMIETISVGAETPMKRKDSKITAGSRVDCWIESGLPDRGWIAGSRVDCRIKGGLPDRGWIAGSSNVLFFS